MVVPIMAAKGLFINSTEQGFTVRGVNNNFFPDNATLAYPANSVILITDDSDMATFRSASNYDVLFSALIKDININGERVTKDNIIETFNEAANKPMGGGGDITGLFADAAYDERQKKIEFYDKDGNEVASIDATDFIKDGMVSDVAISEGNLVITFNTDAGKNAISIPLTDIFNPSNYYTKTQIDGFLSETQTLINTKANSTDVYTKTETDSALGNKANTADVYTKTAVDEKLADYVDIDTYNGKELATANALTQLNEDKADTADLATVATSGSYNDLSDKPTIPAVPTTVSSFTNDAGYVDSNGLNTAVNNLQEQIDTKEEVISTALNTLSTGKADKSEIETLEAYSIDLDALIADGVTSTQYDEIATASADGRVIKAIYDGREYTVESVYVDRDVMKLTVSDELKHRFFQLTKTTGTVSPTTAEYVSLVEKGTWNVKQDRLVSGTNIKTINNESILGEGNLEIQGGGGMDEDTELLISSALVDLNERKIDADEVKENYQKKGDYATNTNLALKANSADVPTLTDYEEAQKITSWSLNELNARIAALEEAMGGMKIVKLTQSEYDALGVKDANTLYVIYSETGTGGF